MINTEKYKIDRVANKMNKIVNQDDVKPNNQRKKVINKHNEAKVNKILETTKVITNNKIENLKVYEDEFGNREVFKQSKVTKIHDELDKVGWRRINPALFLDILIEANFNFKNLKVLRHILKDMSNLNKIYITQTQVIEDLSDEVGRNSVIDTFKKLKDLGVLKKHKYMHIFNPYIISSIGTNSASEIASSYDFSITKNSYNIMKEKEKEKMIEEQEYKLNKLKKELQDMKKLNNHTL